MIIVTGTPGTGKTTFAKNYAYENSCKYVDGNDIIEQYNLKENFDKEMNTYAVDSQKFVDAVLDFIGKLDDNCVIVDSHLSHYIPAKHVEKCYVTKCSLPALKKRLEKRGYSTQKVRENLDAEIFDTCRVEALEAGHNVEVVKTD